MRQRPQENTSDPASALKRRYAELQLNVSALGYESIDLCMTIAPSRKALCHCMKISFILSLSCRLQLRILNRNEEYISTARIK